jgi:hypothetical protein
MNARTALMAIVRWLGTDKTDDEIGWPAQIQSCEECLSEMEQIVEVAESVVDPTERFSVNPLVENLKWSIPHAQEMLAAMRRRDRATALSHANTALRRLDIVDL